MKPEDIKQGRFYFFRKSNAIYAAFNAAMSDVKEGAVHPVPLAIRNAPTRLMKQLGHGS